MLKRAFEDENANLEPMYRKFEELEAIRKLAKDFNQKLGAASKI